MTSGSDSPLPKDPQASSTGPERFHRYGLTGKNGMGDRLNAIEFDAVTEQVLEMRDWEASSPGSNPLSPTLAFPVSAFFKRAIFWASSFFGARSRLSWTGSATGSGESKFGLGRKERRLALGKLGSRENRHHSIIVAGRDGIELMVMTFGALHGVGEEGLTHRVGHVVQPHLARFLEYAHARLFPWAHAQKSGGHEVLGIVRIHLIPCHLFLHEPVIRFVLIE